MQNYLLFLKRKSEGYKPKKAQVLTENEILKFILDESPDKDHLVTKVSKNVSKPTY